MVLLAEPPVEVREQPLAVILEDEDVPRKELAKLLKRRGVNVEQAVGRYNELNVTQGRLRVVLIDIKLGTRIDGDRDKATEIDGIEAAKRIFEESKLVSFIFVSAYVNRSDERRRIRDLESKGIRIADCVDKPLDRKKIDRIIDLIESEYRYLRQIADSGHVPQPNTQISIGHGRSVRGRLEGREVYQGVQPLEAVVIDEEPIGKGGLKLADVQAKINKIYDDMRALVNQRGGEPGFKEAFQPLRTELRRLQEIEADEIERRYLARFKLDLAEGDRLLAQARQRLSEIE